MEIGLVYSKKDPRHKETRAFLRKFVQEHGILADIVESEAMVESPTVTIDGCAITGSQTKSHQDKVSGGVFPSTRDIAKALEQSIWCL